MTVVFRELFEYEDELHVSYDYAYKEDDNLVTGSGNKVISVQQAIILVSKQGEAKNEYLEEILD